MSISLRPYQTDFVARLRSAFTQHRRVLGVSPTGSGKTRCFAYIGTEAAKRGKRVVIVAHRDEIVEQISRALDDLGVRHGRIQPGHRQTDDPVQVAMVQTLSRRLDTTPEPDLLIIDEAHHGVAGTWRTVAGAWQRARILGVTATPVRTDGKGLAGAFDAMVEGPTVADLIGWGFLARFSYLAPPAQADFSSVRKIGGDYAVSDLAQVMDKATITGDSVAHYRQHLDGRPAIVFCVTVAHAEHVAEQFRQAGYSAASVDGTMAKTERRDRMAAIGDGRLNVLASCDLISEGVDVPVVAGAILLRPTQSLGLYLQQVGRALRPKPDGARAVILDHVGNCNEHGMPDAPREWTLDGKARKTGIVKLTTCKVCYRAFEVVPGWKAAAEPCGETDPDCALTGTPEPAERAASPEQVDGELVEVTDARVQYLRDASLPELRRGARSLADFQEIARARGYKPRWAWLEWERRQEWRRRDEPTRTPEAARTHAAPAPARAFEDEVLGA